MKETADMIIAVLLVLALAIRLGFTLGVLRPNDPPSSGRRG